MDESSTPSSTAGMGARLGALGVDWLVVAALQGLIAMGTQAVGQPNAGAWLAGGLLAVAYRAVLHSNHFGGATPGKRLLGLRVVSVATGMPPTLERATLRAAVRVAPAWAGMFVMVPRVDPGDVAALAGRAASAGALVVALEVVTVALVVFDSTGRRALHDLLAGTRVVRASGEPAPPVPSISGRALTLAALVSFTLAGGWHLAFNGMRAVMEEHIVPLSGARQRIEALGCVKLARVTKLTMAASPSVQVVVQQEAECEAPGLAEDAARIVLEEEPALSGQAPLTVMVQEEGHAVPSFADVGEGLAVEQGTVEEWRQRLQGQAAPAP